MSMLTKKVVVSGEERVLFSMDGLSWFLKPEGMHDFERRLRQDAKNMVEESEDFGIEMDVDSHIPVHAA